LIGEIQKGASPALLPLFIVSIDSALRAWKSAGFGAAM